MDQSSLTLDKMMQAIMSVPVRQAPRFYAGSRLAIDAFLDRECKGTFIHEPQRTINRPTTVAGVPVVISAALPRWAFAIAEALGDVTLYDLEYGVSIKGSAMRLPIEVALQAGVERGMMQRMYGPGPRGAAPVFATAGDGDSQATLEGVQEAYEAGRASWEDVCDAAHDQDWGGNSQSWDWSGGD